MIRAFKILGFFLFFLIIYLIINSELSFSSFENTFTTLIFSLFTTIIIVVPKLKRIGIYVLIILWIFTIAFFVVGFIDIANIFGTLAFGFLIISAMLRLLELVKTGKLEKL